MPILPLATTLTLLMLFSFQDKLIFYPMDSQNPRYELFRDHEITVESSGYRLQDWRFVNLEMESKRVFLYFGGNAEGVTYNFSELTRFGVSEIYFLIIVATAAAKANHRCKRSMRTVWRSMIRCWVEV